MYTIPHIFVWGSCFWLCTSASPPRLSLTHLTHTQLVTTQLTHTTQLTPTQLVHAQLVHTQLAHTQLCVARVAFMALGWLWRRAWVLWSPAGMALGDIDLHFPWQAWHLATWTFTLPGRRGTYGAGLALAARLGTLVAVAVCVAGMALGDIDLHFAWQAWRFATWTCALRGRRGAYGTGLALLVRLGTLVAAAVCVAGGTW